MALVKGVNCGFVTVAPTSDPDDTPASFDTRSNAIQDTSPSGAVKITEIGWYASGASEEANFEVAIYTDSGDSPQDIVGTKSSTNAKGTTEGWKRVTGLDISISPSTLYWIAAQLDNTSTSTAVDTDSDASENKTSDADQTELTDPWGTSSTFDGKYAIYAVVETSTPGATDNMTIIGENVY